MKLKMITYFLIDKNSGSTYNMSIIFFSFHMVSHVQSWVSKVTPKKGQLIELILAGDKVEIMVTTYHFDLCSLTKFIFLI